jgi:hypothetical protein
MKLRENEQVLKVFHHHPTPFVFQVFKLILAFIPFLWLTFIFQESVSNKMFVFIHLMLLFLFSLISIYIALIYWLDKLVITNLRVVHIDWKYLTVRDEIEAMLDDIQDISTAEKGILSYFRVFDYGDIQIATASSRVVLKFGWAPDPEGIRRFIYHVRKQ